MLLSILLASLSFGQSTSTVKETLRLDNIAVSIRELQSGRPTMTGTPEFRGGAKVSTLTVSGMFYSTGSAVFQSTATFSSIIDIGLEIASASNPGATTATASCSSGKRTIGGGCFGTATGFALISSSPTVTGWFCDWAGANADRTAYAICGRVK